jgi:hypothetical protein
MMDAEYRQTAVFIISAIEVITETAVTAKLIHPIALVAISMS